jgi:hypothetical protein
MSKDARFTTVSLVLAQDAATVVNAGVSEGLWAAAGGGISFLTQDGRRHFAQAQGTTVVPVAPARREIVEVTGIADAPIGRNLKEVHFRWRYAGLSEVATRYTGQGKTPHESEAIFRLYDDGWRVETITLRETGRVPFAGLPAAVLEKEKEDKQRFAQRLQLSARFEQALGTFSWSTKGVIDIAHTFTLTNVGYSEKTVSRAYGEQERCHWFGQIGKLNVQSWRIEVWPKDPGQMFAISANEADPGQFLSFKTAFNSAYQAWSGQFSDVASRLNERNFADIVAQARPGQQWYKPAPVFGNVACDTVP